MTKDFQAMKPREIESYFRQLILNKFGNEVEDSSLISASRGSYYIELAIDGVSYTFSFKKKSAPRIAKAIKALV